MSEISTLSLTQCETLLRELRSFRTASKKIGARAQSLSKKDSVRVELCPHTPAESVTLTLTKLGITPSDVVYSINPKIQWGARIFIGDTLYDISLQSLTSKI